MVSTDGQRSIESVHLKRGTSLWGLGKLYNNIRGMCSGDQAFGSLDSADLLVANYIQVAVFR